MAGKSTTPTICEIVKSKPRGWDTAIQFARFQPLYGYTSVCSAISRASSTSIPMYLTVLSTLVWPGIIVVCQVFVSNWHFILTPLVLAHSGTLLRPNFFHSKWWVA